MKDYYFDNSATTKVHNEIIEKIANVMKEDYGNPSSKHHRGFIAENLIKESSNKIAKTLKCDSKEIIWTSGGTESNNLAIIGVALANQKRGKHIISSNIEHAAVYKPLEYLISLGFEVTFLKVNEDGKIDLEELKDSIREDTILVSIMHVNNEIGSVNDVKEIGKIIKDKNPKCYFHTDCIQSYGKYKIYPNEMNIDLLSVSGHKIHSPKGVGFLYIKSGTKINPIIYGGGQQKDLRSGTQNVPGIVGLGDACEMCYDNFDKKINHLINIKNYLIDKLEELNNIHSGIYINSKKDLGSAPQIVSVSFENIRAEVLLHALEEKNIYVSSGSACSSNHPAISGTLKAIKVKDNLLDSTIRFSFSQYNTIEEIDYLINVLNDLIPILRKFTRK